MNNQGTIIQTHNGGNGHREVQCSIHGWGVTSNGQCPKCNPPVPKVGDLDDKGRVIVRVCLGVWSRDTRCPSCSLPIAGHPITFTNQ